MASVPIEIVQDSIVIKAAVGGHPVSLILDTGDAIGPVFNSADAARLGLQRGEPFGVEGAGGASTSYETTASITFDDVTYPDEPSAIDDDLQGDSLLGLPFFLQKCAVLSLDFRTRQLTVAAEPPAVAAAEPVPDTTAMPEGGHKAMLESLAEHVRTEATSLLAKLADFGL